MSDTGTYRSEALAQLRAELLTCMGFLTRLPHGHRPDLPPLAKAMRLFPVAGFLIGGTTGLFLGLLWAAHIPALLASVFAVAGALLATGALHEDGLADLADGFGGVGRQDKLAIMRDSRIGTFGVLALVLAILGKVLALGQLTGSLGWGMALVLAATGGASRAAVVWLMAQTPPARTEGLAVSVGRPSKETMTAALALGCGSGLIALWIEVGPIGAVVALGACAGTAWGVRQLALHQIGGQTGDVCGALQVVSEVVMLAILAGTAR